MPFTTDNFTNFNTSYVNGGAGGIGTNLGATDTVLYLPTGAGAGFPSAGNFRFLIGQNLAGLGEICYCNTISGDKMTSILRHQEGTTAILWPIGATVSNDITAATMNNLELEVANHVLGTYNVRDAAYGALGNGVADDTTAIQSACDAARLAGGGTIYLPAGTYMVHLTANVNVGSISAALHVGSNCTVAGDGKEATMIKLIANDALEVQRMVSNWNPQASGTDKHISFVNFSLNGNAANQTGVVNLDHCDGFNFQFVRDLKLVNVISKNHFGTTNGTNGPGGQTGESHQVLAQHCLDVSYVNVDAFDDDGGNISSGLTLSESYNCQVVNCSVHDLTYGNGYAIFAVNGLQMVNCNTYKIGDDGYLFELTNYFTIVGCQAGGIVQALYQAATIAAGTQLACVYGFQFNGSSHGTLSSCSALYASISGFNFLDEVSPATPNTDITLTGCMAGNCTSNGFAIAGTGYDITLSACTAENNGGKGIYNLTTGTAGRVKMIGCRAVSNTGAGIQVDGSAPHFTDVISCESIGNGSVASFGGTTYTAITGPLTAPGVPATTVALTNPFPFPVTVHIINGTVTVINVGGTNTGVQTTATTYATVRLASGQNITLTYSAAPTWTWFGD